MSLPPGEFETYRDGRAQFTVRLAANTPIEIIFRLNREGRLEIKAEEMSPAHRSVNVTIETRSVIRGKEFEEAKARAKHIVVI